MKAIFKLLILVVNLWGITSCKNGTNDEVFEAVEFETSGVNLTKLKGSANSFYAEISSEGGIITLEAKGKNKKNGFLSTYKIDGVSHDVSANNAVLIAQGEWGKIERVSSSPHITRITLCENKRDSIRKIELCFGVAYKTSNILIRQLRNLSQ